MAFLPPEPTRLGRSFETAISYYHHQWLQFKSGKQDGCQAERYACGFPIPPFQREPGWDLERAIKFIESCWLGLPLLHITHHRFDWNDSSEALPQSGWLLDGQNRLLALEAYFCDELEVFGGKWSELSMKQRRQFLRIGLPHFEPEFWNDDTACRDYYNRMAFGGIAHTENDRA